MENGTNIVKLVDFVNEEDPALAELFLSILEVCFNCHEHRTQKF